MNYVRNQDNITQSVHDPHLRWIIVSRSASTNEILSTNPRPGGALLSACYCIIYGPGRGAMRSCNYFLDILVFIL